MAAIHILGASPSTKVYKYANAVNRRTIEFWAERGGVTMKCEDDQGKEDYRHLMLPEFLKRITALAKELAVIWLPSERAERRSLISAMLDCAEKAKEQGDPTQPGVIETIAAERPRPVSFREIGLGDSDKQAFVPISIGG